MLFHVKNNVKVPRRPSKHPGLAISTEPDTRSVLDPSRYLRFHSALPQHAAFALAFGARIGDHAAYPLACRTRSSHGEESLLVAHLAFTLAGAARYRSLPRSGARARTIFASLVPPDIDFRFLAEHGFLKLKREILSQIGTALSSRSAASRTPTEHLSNAEELAEDIAQVLECVRIKTSASRPGYPRVAKAIVGRPLIGIHQDCVGFCDFSKLLFRIRIVGIPVRMVLHGQFAIRALDLLLSALALYT
jgi:hypothetical protein